LTSYAINITIKKYTAKSIVEIPNQPSKQYTPNYIFFILRSTWVNIYGELAKELHLIFQFIDIIW
jgi:hypothetical protein